VIIVASAKDKADDKRNNQDTNNPNDEGSNPAGAVALGRARKPPPIVVPATNKDDPKTVPYFSSDPSKAVALSHPGRNTA
jgi:hypothetical protein